jgi:nucleotide-binding universal stress UspA family protein
MITKILAASDGSPAAMEAARSAAVMAAAFGASLTVVTVATIPKMYKGDLSDEMQAAYREDYEHVLRDTVHAIGGKVKAGSKLLHEDSAAEAILAEAERGKYDLIVVGSTGTDNPYGRAMGSVASKVGARARCSVLIIR